MKKLISLVLILILALFAVGCDTDSGTPDTPSIGGENASDSPDASLDGNKGNQDKETTADKPEDKPEEKPEEKPEPTVDMLACLETLLEGYRCHPMAAIPDTMLSDYAPNLVKKDDLVTDYYQPVHLSDIPTSGVGEQWSMVLDNLEQSAIFFNTLSVIDGLTTVSVSAFQNYLDQNPANTARHQFEHGIYSVTIDCDSDTVAYVLDYTAEIPKLGQQTVQIALSMDIETQVKSARIQLGDANALAYTLTSDGYSFAIRYLGVRRAYFALSQDEDGNVTGHVYEYLTVSDVEIASVADFYINEDTVTVVGNKADSLVGFDGYICELYHVSNGRMMGYEVRESLEVSGVGVTYNTLWFDLDSLSGIQSIQYRADGDKAYFYLNGSSRAFENKSVGILGGLKAASRRYDIEFRTQYFYSYNEATASYERTAVQVPMLFVQDEYLDTLSEDVKDKNSLTLSLTLSDTGVEALRTAYGTKVDILIENKDAYSVETILSMIGSPIRFS